MIGSLSTALLDAGLVLAGHGYDFRGSPSSDSGGGDDGGGIGTAWIVAVALLVLGTAAVMWWLSRSERDADGQGAARGINLKAAAPVVLIVVVMAVPLAVWTASSGGDDEFDLKVERFTSVTNGAPELLVSIGEDVANTLEAASGNRTVRVRCVGRDGKQILDADQKWPFIRERGYEFAHAHQAATPAQVQRADRCRVLGTRTVLSAAVEGKLKD